MNAPLECIIQKSETSSVDWVLKRQENGTL